MKKYLTSLKHFIQKNILPFLAVRIGKGLMRLLLFTCRWDVSGLEHFKKIAERERCILMLWHNRLAITPFILYKFAPQFIYAAFVSNSRDGELISAIVESYKFGKTIRVPHNARAEALRELIRHVKAQQDIVVITPDGPRGPRYEVKPGVAMAALETSAYVVPLSWEADRSWTFNTWDKLQLPKPFSKIKVSFENPVQFSDNILSTEQAQAILQTSLVRVVN
ncbi:MAG: lysophospholipid acyltransferase family protein [Parachlamydiaceae bacterium]|nr:lysophospholipid acyltransferase family protein [Parachlamydiaceae bacterium]